MRINRVSPLWLMLALPLAACGGNQPSSGHGAQGGTGSAGGSSSSPATDSDAPATTAAADGSDAGAATGSSPRPRSGVEIHVQDVHAGGALPSEADPNVDHLDVSFAVALSHHGQQALTGITLARVRLVHDDGRSVTFGVTADGWDGSLAVGATQTVVFHKTPDSASPRATSALCGQPMRLEVTLDILGHQAVALSRHARIECAATGR